MLTDALSSDIRRAIVGIRVPSGSPDQGLVFHKAASWSKLTVMLDSQNPLLNSINHLSRARFAVHIHKDDTEYDFRYA